MTDSTMESGQKYEPGQHPDLPPPVIETGVIGWMRKNLFSSWANTLMTLVSLYLIYLIVPPVFDWVIFSANFGATTKDQCTQAAQEFGRDGACWAVIQQRIGLFLYGFYVKSGGAEGGGALWRLIIAVILLVPAIAFPLFDKMPYRKQGMIFSALFPFIAFWLLYGGDIAESWAQFGLGVVVLLLVALVASGRVATPELVRRIATYFGPALFLFALLGNVSGPAGQEVFTIGQDPDTGGTRLIILGAAYGYFWLGLTILMAALWIFSWFRKATLGQDTVDSVAGGFAVVFFVASLSAHSAQDGIGLPIVDTSEWGGLLVTLCSGLAGITVSLPAGVLLALGRRSHMPVVRMVCTVFIEVIRGVPLITLLFMGSVMLPLFLPEGVTFDKFLRALIVVCMFASAYQAEVIRGGLQAIPSGQYEAANALGLSYWQGMRLIILPQALQIVIPGIVNTFIGLFKDTTLLSIIGILDPLAIGKSTNADSDWLGLVEEIYVFLAIMYFCFCFCMSRYSIWLERKLYTGHRT